MAIYGFMIKVMELVMVLLITITGKVMFTLLMLVIAILSANFRIIAKYFKILPKFVYPVNFAKITTNCARNSKPSDAAWRKFI